MLVNTTVAAAQAQLAVIFSESHNQQKFTAQEIQEAGSRKFMQIFGGSKWVEAYEAQNQQGEISTVREVVVVTNAYDQTYIPFC